MVENSFPSFISEVIAYINQRFSSLPEEPYSYFTVFDPKEMPQDQADLATYGNKEVSSLVDYFYFFYYCNRSHDDVIMPYALVQKIVHLLSFLA